MPNDFGYLGKYLRLQEKLCGQSFEDVRRVHFLEGT